MIRSIVLSALVGTAYAAVSLDRTYDADKHETTFSYQVDGNVVAFAVPAVGCTLVSATQQGILSEDEVYFDSVSYSNVEFTLQGNIPKGQAGLTVTDDSGAVSNPTNEGPNCAEADPKPDCSITVQNSPTCADGVATISVSTSISAASYLFESDVGEITNAETTQATMRLPVDSCQSSATVKLTLESHQGSRSTCEEKAWYNYTGALSFESVPENSNAQDGDVPKAETLSSTGADPCFEPTIEFTESRTSGDANYVVTRTWTLSDMCVSDNVIAQQDITVTDTTPPVLAGIPASESYVSCDNVPPPCEATAFDEGDDAASLVQFSETRADGSCPNEYTLFRTWKASDSSGNEVVGTQTIHVADNENPVLIGIPSAIEVQCDSIPIAASVNGHDNCDQSVHVISSEETWAGGLVRTWTVTDSCGNDATASQTITVTDSTPPILSGVAPSETVECNLVPAVPCEVRAKDACDSNVEVSMTKEIIPGTCDESYEIVYTWSAEDAANNPVEASQTITVQDTNAPTITGTLPSNMPVTCFRDVPDNSAAYDDCDEDVAVVMDEQQISYESENRLSVVRTYSATDSCGNSATAVATINFQDDTAPTLDNTPMPFVTVQCSNVPTANVVTGTDNCACGGSSAVAVDFTEERTDGTCDHQYTLLRTWSASDCSGNTVSFTETVNVVDTDAPAIDSVADQSKSCEEDNSQAAPTATDVCAGVVATDLTETRIDGGCVDSFTLVRTWTASDDCGNTDSVTSTTTVSDAEAPTLDSNPAHVPADCAAVPSAETVTATDNCATITPTFTQTRMDGSCPDQYILVRNWHAEDNCGLTDSWDQTISVTDDNEPTIPDCVSDLNKGNIELYDDVNWPAAPVYTAKDNCASPTVTFKQWEDGPLCEQTLFRTWTTTDDCGRQSATCTHAFMIRDSTPPTITAPEDETLDCDFGSAGNAVANIDAFAAGKTAIYAGNGAIHSGPTCVETSKTCSHSVTYTCTYTVTDECGLTAQDTMVVTVKDNSAPELSAEPDHETNECDDVAVPPITATDNCEGSITVDYTLTEIAANAGVTLRQYEQSWTASDSCGNEAGTSRTVTIEDNNPPTIVCPEPEDIDCAADQAGVDIDVVSSSDTCDTAPATTYEDQQLGTGCDGSFSRTYTITDHAGHTATCDVSFNIQDSADPTCSDAPVDRTAECGDDLTQPDLVGCEDNCDASPTNGKSQSSVEFESSSSKVVSAVHNYWHSTDDCGNKGEFFQTITVYDTTNPVFSSLPAGVTTDCTYSDPAPSLSATDVCGEADVTLTETEPSSSCTPYSFSRTWTATDESGNTATHTQNIQVNGDTTLIWDAAHSEGVLDTVEHGSVDETVFTSAITASHDCNTVNAVCESTRVDGSCDNAYQLVNTCTATDDCSGTISFSQTLIVVDTTAPPVDAGEDLTIKCENSADIDANRPANCEDGERDCAYGCDNCYSFTRTCSVQDDCGNQATDDAVVTVVDLSVPTLTVPDDTSADCSEDIPTTEATATDNCDANPAVQEHAEATTSDDDATNQLKRTTIRTFSATDSCGLTTTKSQTITFHDTTDPGVCSPYTDTTAENTNVPTYGGDFPRPTSTQMDSCVCPGGDPTDDCGSVDLSCERVTEEGTCAQSFSHVYTWTSVDDEGNDASGTYTVTIHDTVAPVFNPSDYDDVTVQVINIPAPDTPSATDASGSSTSITFDETRIDGANENEFTLIRTWTVVDECGNSEAMDQTVTVIDTVAPDITGVPPSITVECSNDPLINIDDVAAQVSHWADETTTVTHTVETVQGSCPQSFTVVYTFTATDEADNTKTADYSVTVQDTAAPEWSSLPLPTSDTIDACETPAAVDPTATDACKAAMPAGGAYYATSDVPVTLSETTAAAGTDGDYDVTRTWTATDDCGHSISHTITLHMRDTTKPYFNGAVDGAYTVTFPGEHAANDATVDDTCVVPAAETLTCGDACGECTVTMVEEDGPSDCAQPSKTYKYTATDSRGNTETYQYTITFTDNAPPTFESLADEEHDLCQAVPPRPSPVFTDLCDDDVAVSGPNTALNGAASTIYTWTGTDDCGNSADVSQTVTLVDYNEPVLTVPEDATFTCDQVVLRPEATATDDCGDDLVEIDVTEVSQSSSCGSEYTIIRTFTAYDGTHTVTDVQTISVIDDGAPALQDAPDDVTVDDQCAAPEPATLTYTDCGAPETSDATVSTSDPEYINGLDHTVVHTWTAVDGCGNTAGVRQTVTVLDITPPVITPVGDCDDAPLSCDATDPVCTPTAEDECDEDVSVEVTEERTTGCNAVLIRTYTASDDSGNQATPVIQTLDIHDSETPVFDSLPSTQRTCECTDACATHQLTATDNCEGDVDVTMTTNQVVDDTQTTEFPKVFVNEWVTSDSCGNTVTFTQTVTVEDNTPPEFDDVPDETKTCGDEGYVIPDPVAGDGCSSPTVVSSNEQIGTCPVVVAYSFTATDSAGNTRSDVATVTFVDDVPPTLVGDFSDLTYNCTFEAHTQPTVTDDCTDVYSITVPAPVITDIITDPQTDGSQVLKKFVRTWTVQDDCGNPASEDQTVTVVDTEDPVVSCTNCEDKTVEACNAIIPTPIVSATDNCDMSPSTSLTKEAAGDECLMTHIWTYCATDDVGNNHCLSNTVTVEDFEAPSILNVESDTTKSCQLAPHVFSPVKATDCITDIPLTPVMETVGGSCEDTYDVVATWSYTDSCGLSASDSQTVSFVDDAAPTLDAPAADKTAECDNVPSQDTLSGSDSCDGSVEVTPVRTTAAGSCTDEYTITDTWTASDNCGQTDSGSQQIDVSDNTPPVLANTCAPVTIECDETPSPCNPTATDACDGNLAAVAEDVESVAGSSPNDYLIVRTYTVSDECGNPASDVQTITVTDTTPPELSGPSDSTNEYPNIPFAYDGDHTYTDNCNLVSTSCDETTRAGSCPYNYVLVRTCTASDATGNPTTHSYEVTIQDTTPPEIHGVPADATVEYGSEPSITEALELVRATDNSGASLTVSVSETRTDGANTHEYQLTRTFSVEDECGNAVTETQIVTVIDTCPPTLNEEPADETVDCDAVPAPCTLTTVGESLPVQFTQAAASGGVYIRTWSVADEAGNTASHTQTVTVVDNAAPILSRKPADETVACSCDDFPDAPTIAGLDNCDESVVPVFTEEKVTVNGPDEYLLIRTWTAEDNASNSVEHTQTITVQDGVAPTIYPVPADVDASCANVPAAVTVSALDNCDDSPSVVYSSETVTSGCVNSYKEIRSWTATDRSGNAETYSQTVGVTDSNAPHVEALDDGCVMGSAGDVSYTMAELFAYQDDCATSPVLSFVSCNSTSTTISCSGDDSGVSLSGVSSASIGDVLSVYVSVADACGNSATGVARINVHNEASAAGAGAEDCKVPAEAYGGGK